MRRAVIFAGFAILAWVGYIFLADWFYWGKTDVAAILFAIPKFFDLPIPFRLIEFMLLGFILLGSSFLFKGKAKTKRGKKSKPKLETKGKSPYDIEVVIVGKGINHHEHIQTSKLTTTYKHNDAEYKVDPRKLYVSNRGIFRRIKDKISGVQRRFCIVFQEGQSLALGPEQAQTEKVSSGLLHVVERSTIFRRAFAELFAKQIGGKKIVFIIILVVVGALVYLMWSGQLDLRRLGF